MHYKIPVVALVLLSIYTVSGADEFSTNDEITETNSDDGSFGRVRRGFNMLRLGRGLQMLRLGKRALPMLRMGRAADGLDNGDLQYLLSVMRSERQVPLPRYGKDLAYVLMKALKNAEDNGEEYFDDGASYDGFNFGYPYTATAERQIRPAPRPGRYRRSAGAEPPKVDGDEYKYAYTRVAPLMRYGKLVEEGDLDQDTEKRAAMRMLRLGRGMRMLRLGKRPVDAAGDEVTDYTEADKRALRLLRLGKRPAFHMLRMGRGGADVEPQEDEKRALRLLRLGKRSDSETEAESS